jgi:hypothetical protein
LFLKTPSVVQGAGFSLTSSDVVVNQCKLVSTAAVAQTLSKEVIVRNPQSSIQPRDIIDADQCKLSSVATILSNEEEILRVLIKRQ